MWKRLLRISGLKNTGVLEYWSVGVFAQRVESLLHYSITPLLLLLFTVSCAPRHVELPSYEGIPVENALSELKNIKSIEAVLSVEYEKNDSTMSGDALLNISEDKLNLRLYYLGFLVGEVSEDNGIIKSKPKLDKNKSTILIDGLKSSFFWWNIRDYTLQEKEDAYELKNSYRKLLISKKTLLPVQQTIELNDGEELRIFYDIPAKSNNESTEEINQQNQPLNSKPVWYNSQLKIEFKNYIVKIKVKSYSAR